MGTYQLLRGLRKHWINPISPVYRADQRFGPPWPPEEAARWRGRLVRFGLAVILAVVLITAGRALTGASSLSALYMLALPAACLTGVSLLFVALTALTFLWPVAVALLVSGTIVREREQRTWAPLLTTPLDWGEVLMAKLASALHWLNRPFELMVWVQGALTVFVFLLCVSQAEQIAAPPTVGVLIALLAAAQFALARVQDYASACLIGVGASLLAEKRETAWGAALMGGVGLVIGRVLITGLLMLNIALGVPPTNETAPQAVVILLATGPTAGLVLALKNAPWLALALLIVLPISRELLIRFGYRWVLAHLGESAGNG